MKNVNFTVYAISEFLSKGIMLLTIPLITDNLSREDFGTLSIYESLFATLSVLIIFSIQNGYSRYFQTIKLQDRLGFTNNILQASIILSFLWFIAIIIIIGFMPNTFEHNTSLLVILTTFRSAFSQMNALILSKFIMEQKAAPVALATICRSALVLAIVYLCDVFYTLSILYILIAYIIAEFTCLTIFITRAHFWFVKPNYHYLHKVAAFSLWVIPTVILYTVISTTDKYFLSYYQLPGQLADYSLAQKVGLSLTPFVVIPFQKLFGPIKYRYWNRKVSYVIFQQYFEFYIGLSLLVFLVLFILREPIILLVANEQYLNSSRLIPGVALAAITYGALPLFTIYIQKESKNYLTTSAMFLGAIINVFLNFVFIPSHGANAAVATTLISFLIVNIALIYLSVKVCGGFVYQISLRMYVMFLTVILLCLFTTQLGSHHSLQLIASMTSYTVIFYIFYRELITRVKSSIFRSPIQ